MAERVHPPLLLPSLILQAEVVSGTRGAALPVQRLI